MITDAYTIQFLLESTLALPPSIDWREVANESLSFAATVGVVAITITEIHTRAGVRTELNLRSDGEEFSLYAPIPVGWFGKRFASPGDKDLADRLKELLSAAAQQCADRREQARAHPDDLRERMYRKLLFGQFAEAGRQELVKA
jgi:hypothetical protein